MQPKPNFGLVGVQGLGPDALGFRVLGLGFRVVGFTVQHLAISVYCKFRVKIFMRLGDKSRAFVFLKDR